MAETREPVRSAGSSVTQTWQTAYLAWIAAAAGATCAHIAWQRTASTKRRGQN